MNSGAVISRYETKEKICFLRRLSGLLDPRSRDALFAAEASGSLRTCGYFRACAGAVYDYAPISRGLMDRWAEGIPARWSKSLPKRWRTKRDYDTMSEYMLSATLALNDMIRMGVTQDWATHMIGHELTALHGLTHGATLAIVINGTLRVLRGQKRGKLLQYGERI